MATTKSKLATSPHQQVASMLGGQGTKSLSAEVVKQQSIQPSSNSSP